MIGQQNKDEHFSIILIISVLTIISFIVQVNEANLVEITNFQHDSNSHLFASLVAVKTTIDEQDEHLKNGNNNFKSVQDSAGSDGKSKQAQEMDYYYPEQILTPQIERNHVTNLYEHSRDTQLSDSTQHQDQPKQLFNYNKNRLPEKEYLSHELSEKACRVDRGCQRRDGLNNTYLSYCSRYKLENLLSNAILMSIMHDSSEECENILDEFIQLDEVINQFDRLFKNLLQRYNCHNGYSVKWNCDDCKRAYKDWLCSTNLPYYMNGERIKPCISFCERVEQRCPYLHPITKEQYGGQPVFICRDRNIPFVPEITPDIPYSEPSKCYDMCHLSQNKTELVIDTLSKYEYGKCPEKSSIAEEVRGDPLYCKVNNVQYEVQNRTEVPPFDSSSDSNVNSTDTIDLVRKPPANELHVHLKKLIELREVLTVYKNQPKTHRFGHHSDHVSVH